MPKFETRFATEADYDFLYRLHRQTFHSYVEVTWGWDEDWQAQHFRADFDPSRCNVIMLSGKDVGCFRVDDGIDYLFLDYIAIEPEYQNKGIGTSVVRMLLSRAAKKGVPMRLNVLRVNPARALYEKLGFKVIGADEFRHYMEAAVFRAG
jgi:ribosomal protein S18 acetylase RimI-like enzyme